MKAAIKQLCKPIVVGTLLAIAVVLAAEYAARCDGQTLVAEYVELIQHPTELPYRIIANIRFLPKRLKPTCSECNNP